MTKRIVIVFGLIMASAVAAGCGFNSSVTADEDVKAKWSDVEAAYQRRYDLIPNLVKTVQGSANFEKSTLTAVIEARASATQVKLTADDLSDPAKMAAFQAAQSQLSSALSRLMVVAEQYPQLKSTQAFADLMTQLEGTENRINTEIHKYNELVAEYNKIVRHFPTMIGASIRGLKERPSFKAKPGAENAPQVDFGGTAG